MKVKSEAEDKKKKIQNKFCENWTFDFLSVYQAVTALVKNFPKPMVSSMQQILPIVWNTLTESAALYPWDIVSAYFLPPCWGKKMDENVVALSRVEHPKTIP